MVVADGLGLFPVSFLNGTCCDKVSSKTVPRQFWGHWRYPFPCSALIIPPVQVKGLADTLKHRRNIFLTSMFQ